MNNTAFRLQQQLQTAGWEATQWQTFWFAQDDIRVRPDLTLNLGLRYELSEVPLGMLGATDPQSLSVLVPGPAKMDRNNWAPRVGLAWSPNSKNTFLGDGTTVVRGGFGVGYDVLFYRVIPFGDRHLRRTIAEFVEHYLRERNHQGLENGLIDGARAAGHVGGIRRRQRLGGLLNRSRGLMTRERRFDASAQLMRHSGLAVLVPRPRINLILYRGALGPRAAWRAAVVRRQRMVAMHGSRSPLRRRLVRAGGYRAAPSARPVLGVADATHLRV